MDDWIAIRRASFQDVPFIRHLAIESVLYTVPEGRDIDNETVKGKVAEVLKDLEKWVYRRRECAVLVAEDTTRDHHRAGYIIIEFNHLEEATGERQSYVYDLAVEQGYMGKYVGHRLVREAARVSHQHGFRYMSANISASNQRALLSAIKLGFEVERFGLIMACGEKGIDPMPGRPPEQRGHAVNRAMRQLRRQRKNNTTEEQQSNHEHPDPAAEPSRLS
ncbi:MAG TPA: GNAT family N-acetyltransferase [Candidatus Xenobia bacterium]